MRRLWRASSKLQTGKSFPSQDVYQRREEAFSLDTEAMVGALYPAALYPAALYPAALYPAALYPAALDRLREIEAVRKHLLEREHNTRLTTRGWFNAGLGALVAGGALVSLAQIDRGGAATQYTYKSSGVILPGESLDVFTMGRCRLSPTTRNA